MDRDELITRLEHCVMALDEMVDGVMLNAMKMNVSPYTMVSTNGVPVLAPLISSQVSCLVMLATLDQ